MKHNKLNVFLLCLALLLVFGGSYYANLIQTSHGEVKLRHINFVTEDGINLHALLYIPDSATDQNPAPGIVSSHGYNNTAEVQNLNAVELSRRGYVVMAIDAYWHGLSGGTSLNVANKNIVPDMGGYAALQYLGTLPFVNKNDIGMVGHSMGCAVIQSAALRAFTNHESNPAVTVPKSLLLTSNAYAVNADGSALAYAAYPVNVGVIYGAYDEWSENMWGPEGKIGSNVINTPKAVVGMGFAGAKYDTYYAAGVDTPLSREEAVEAAKNNVLRVFHQPPTDHPQVHFSSLAGQPAVEFFDITLRGGQTTLPASDMIWWQKEAATFTAMVGFFLFMLPFAFLLLNCSFFSAMIQPEPQAPTIISDSASRKRYWKLYLLCLIPAPLIFYWAVGYPIDIVSMGRAVPIVMPASSFFPLPAVNGIVVVCVIMGIFLLGLFSYVFKKYMAPAGATFHDTGVPLCICRIFRAALLAIITFLASYALLALANYFFQSDFRLFVFSVKTLSPDKWLIFLKYLIPFLFFFLVFSLTANSFTRIRNKSEWINLPLILLASCGGYIVLCLLDYSGYLFLGHKLFMYVPFFGQNTTALAGLFVWNMIFILPISALIIRICFKKTGSIWLGGFLVALVVTLFAISNTVIAAGTLL